MWPLREDFKPGAPLSQIEADWLNMVARILNHLRVVGGKLSKTANPTETTPWTIEVEHPGINPADSLDAPETHTDLRTNTEASLASAGTASWTRAGTVGCKRTTCVGVSYDHTQASPQLLFWFREEYLDAKGRPYYVGPIQNYTVDIPDKIEWGGV
jgi:hypothetical protein